MPWLSVYGNIQLALRSGEKKPIPYENSGQPNEISEKNRNRIHKVSQKKLNQDSDEIIQNVLNLVGLKGFDHAMPHELSIGMKQKVAIARSFVMGSELLLLDEPFASLDEQTRLRLNREMIDLWLKKGKTVLFVTHSIQEALVLGTRIVLLSVRPACVVDQWKLPSAQKCGEDRLRERLYNPEIQGIAHEIRSKLELCCPPEASSETPCACGCKSSHVSNE